MNAFSVIDKVVVLVTDNEVGDHGAAQWEA